MQYHSDAKGVWLKLGVGLIQNHVVHQHEVEAHREAHPGGALAGDAYGTRLMALAVSINKIHICACVGIPASTQHRKSGLQPQQQATGRHVVQHVA